MKLSPLVNAGLVIETPDVRLCIDPWLSDTAHYGSWAPWPRVPDLIDRVGPVDLVIISHIHHDHFSVPCLRELLRRNPEARVVIGDFKQNFLHHAMRREGIPHSIAPQVTFGDTEIRIFCRESYRDDIDAVIAIKRGNQSFVHWIDVPYSAELVERVKAFCPDIAFAALPFTGASAWPHCYYDLGSAELENALLKRRRLGVEWYRNLREHLAPKIAMPWSSGYLLAGRLWHLNPYRGALDAVGMRAHDESALILGDDGTTFDLDTGQASAIRDKPYDSADIMREALRLSTRLFDYERQAIGDWQEGPSLVRWEQAHLRALKHSEVPEDYWYCFRHNAAWVCMNARKGVAPDCDLLDDVSHLLPRSEIYADIRMILGAITGKYHWNNLAGGSHFMTRRFPDVYDRETDDWLNHFHV